MLLYRISSAEWQPSRQGAAVPLPPWWREAAATLGLTQSPAVAVLLSTSHIAVAWLPIAIGTCRSALLLPVGSTCGGWPLRPAVASPCGGWSGRCLTAARWQSRRGEGGRDVVFSTVSSSHHLAPPVIQCLTCLIFFNRPPVPALGRATPPGASQDRSPAPPPRPPALPAREAAHLRRPPAPPTREPGCSRRRQQLAGFAVHTSAARDGASRRS